jgi:hypothetical protein
MARITVRVDLPTGNPEKLIKLAQKISAKHLSDLPNSPLNVEEMTKLAAAAGLAETAHSESEKHNGLAQSYRQARDSGLGIADGQTIRTPETALNLIAHARDQLLVKYEGLEEKLTEYGFDVVIGTAKSPTRKNGNGTTQ